MKKTILVLAACLACLYSQAQVASNDYNAQPAPVKQSGTTEKTLSEEISGYYPACGYMNLDDASSFIVSMNWINCDGIGGGLNMRYFRPGAENYALNYDLNLNYTIGLARTDKVAVFATLAFGPSIGSRDVFDGINKYGRVETKNKIFCDGYGDATINIKSGRFLISAGYAIWGAEFKFSKDYKADGYVIRLGYDF